MGFPFVDAVKGEPVVGGANARRFIWQSRQGAVSIVIIEGYQERAIGEDDPRQQPRRRVVVAHSLKPRTAHRPEASAVSGERALPDMAQGLEAVTVDRDIPV
jgi:hypothetical protein